MYAFNAFVVHILTLLLCFNFAKAYPEARVVNGINANIKQFPFMVSIRFSNGKHTCGGSIIAANWILTAAHCVAGHAAKSMSVQYGVSNISATPADVTSIAAVKRFIIHEQYTPAQDFANDIALIELQQQLQFNANVQAVQLPAAYFEIEQTLEGAQGTLTGWGRNATNGVTQTTLQAATLKIYSDQECNQRHKGDTTAQQICAGLDAGGKGQCTGDSGSPLTTYDGRRRRRVIQLGIVSWSMKPCATAPYPGVFTKVSHYIDWIGQHVNLNELKTEKRVAYGIILFKYFY